MRKKTLYNIKGAGRPAIHDRGIRHIARDKIKKKTVMHLTVKILRDKAGLRNKNILNILKVSIQKARLFGLKIVHYTLEYDHVHLMIETDNNEVLGKGMQSFGISFSKGINKIKECKGKVFKTRYHFRKLETPKEVKNALFYILGNSKKHRSALSSLNPFNSLLAMDTPEVILGFPVYPDEEVKKIRDTLFTFLEPPEHFLIKKIT